MAYIRTKISFALLKSVLIAIHGIRGKQTKKNTPISEVSFGLIPSESQKRHYMNVANLFYNDCEIWYFMLNVYCIDLWFR